MPTEPTWTEFYQGWSLSDTAGTKVYTGIGGDLDDLVDVKESLSTAAGDEFGGLPISETSVEEISNATTQKLYRGRVSYGTAGGGGGGSQAPETALMSFNTGGATEHISHRLSGSSTVGYPAGTAGDFEGAIGVDGTGNVTGVDIVARQFSFSITKVIPAASMTGTYIGKIYALTAKVNNASFNIPVEGSSHALAAGECLFVGASGSKRRDGAWEITFNFIGSPNKTGLQVGSITGIEKKGHQYLWVFYRGDVSNSVHIMKPESAYVETVYETGNFADLNP